MRNTICTFEYGLGLGYAEYENLHNTYEYAVVYLG